MKLFRRKKKEQAPAPNAYDIGLKGTPEQFLTEGKLYNRAGESAVELELLQKGAIDAFFEGDVENLQTLLAHQKSFSGKNYWGEVFSPDVLDIFKQLHKTGQGPAAITVATETMDPEEKQAALDMALHDAMTEFSDDAKFVKTLLAAGAKADADIHGSTGDILAMAATNGAPAKSIKALYNAGADFNEALLHVRTNSWWDRDDRREQTIRKLDAHCEALTGERLVEDTSAEKLEELRAQVAELTKQVKKSAKPGAKSKAKAQKKNPKPK